MQSFLLTVLSIIASIIVTILVSRYYFKRTVDKKLTPYIHVASAVLAGIDPHVRQDLKISYREVEVDDIFQLQFLIANEGQRSIRDCIEPLSLTLPADVRVLDSKILHIYPKGREVKIENIQNPDGTTRVEFYFKLLNSGEFFLVKLLLKGLLQEVELDFKIAVDDLPPLIPARWLPFQETKSPVTSIDWSVIYTGAIMMIVSLCLVYLLFIARGARPELFPLPWIGFKPHWGTLILATSAVGTLLCFITGCIFIFNGFEDVRRRPRFILPSDSTRYASSLPREVARIMEMSRKSNQDKGNKHP